MPQITYIESNGTRHCVDVASGTSVMQGAIDNAIAGVVGECGGGLSCATCHCYVDEDWSARVGTAAGTEADMLGCVVDDRKTGSRLSCQIVVTDTLSGLVVHLPARQL